VSKGKEGRGGKEEEGGREGDSDAPFRAAGREVEKKKT